METIWSDKSVGGSRECCSFDANSTNVEFTTLSLHETTIVPRPTRWDRASGPQGGALMYRRRGVFVASRRSAVTPGISDNLLEKLRALSSLERWQRCCSSMIMAQCLPCLVK